MKIRAESRVPRRERFDRARPVDDTAKGKTVQRSKKPSESEGRFGNRKLSESLVLRQTLKVSKMAF